MQSIECYPNKMLSEIGSQVDCLSKPGNHYIVIKEIYQWSALGICFYNELNSWIESMLFSSLDDSKDESQAKFNLSLKINWII